MRVVKGNADPKVHWLDHAIPKFEPKFVNYVKAVLNIIIIFLPFPMFWALGEQPGSRWVLQAAQLNGNVGFYDIKPDQISVILPLMVMVFIALNDIVIYPMIKHIGIKTDTQRLVVGAFSGALAFVAAGILEYHSSSDNNIVTTSQAIHTDSFHMLWMIPQFVFLAMGEAIVGVIGLRFAYNEAPKGMKTVLMACWLLTVSAGNLIVMFIVSLRLFETEVTRIFNSEVSMLII